MKNQVIKVLNETHGEKVIEFWKYKGIDTRLYTGRCNENKHADCYYGTIEGEFGNFTINQVKRYNAEIIELPTEYHESEFNSNDKLMDEKEIIGYILDKKKYIEAVKAIYQSRSDCEYIKGLTVEIGSDYYTKLKDAGVLHWFKPVYKEKTIKLKSGIELSESDLEEVKQILNK